MEDILTKPISPTFSDKIIKILSFLNSPTTVAIYNPPFEILCWFWFLAYVVNFSRRHNRKAFKHVPRSFLVRPLSKNYTRFVAIVERYCSQFFGNRAFKLKYNDSTGFYIESKTTDWLFLITNVSGTCYSMPEVIVEALDQMGCHYFHEHGLLIGPIAFINHRCDCGVSYGFDWQRLKKKTTRSSACRSSDVVPVYLSWDVQRQQPTIPKLLQVGDEVVVKYFEPDDHYAYINMNTWFNGKCTCIQCMLFSNLLSEDLPGDLQTASTYSVDKLAKDANVSDAVIKRDVLDLSVEAYHASVEKRYKVKAIKKARSLYNRWPWNFAKPLVVNPQQPQLLGVQEFVPDIKDVWVGELSAYLQSKRRRLK